MSSILLFLENSTNAKPFHINELSSSSMKVMLIIFYLFKSILLTCNIQIKQTFDRPVKSHIYLWTQIKFTPNSVNASEPKNLTQSSAHEEQTTTRK